MAKISFTKLNLKKVEDTKINLTFNDQVIEVRQYLPVEEKLNLIERVLSYCADDENNFVNNVKLEVYTALEILYTYTNINFTDKQKEEPAKLYDLCLTNGLIPAILDSIPEEEKGYIYDNCRHIVGAYFKYLSSALGIIEAMKTEYNVLDMDIEGLHKKLGDENNLQLLRQVLTKLG